MSSAPYSRTSILDAREYFGVPTMGASSNGADISCHMSHSEAERSVLNFNLTFPRSNEGNQEFARYVAAEINNYMMRTGSYPLRLVADEDLLGKVEIELKGRYSQVGHLSRLLNPQAQAHAGSLVSLTGASWHRSPPARTNGPIIGVNVGQTFIKGYARNPETGEEVNLKSGLFDGDGTKGERICRNTEEMFLRLVSYSERVPALGLTVGGIVQDGWIIPESGITSGLSEPDLSRVVNLPMMLMRSIGRPIFIEQDARAKAYYHSALGKRKCLIMDIGTSLGGSYVDSSGCIPRYLNQVGRIAWDLSDVAAPRQDGRGAGLLSQLLSANGLMAVAKTEHLNISQANRIDEALGQQFGSAQEAARTFCRLFTAVVPLLSDYYDLSEIVITGGVVSGRLGNLILEAAKQHLGSGLEVTSSDEPEFDSAIGVAWASAVSTME
jgi:predicted NBD/HSP70 family sugar kinase